VTLARDRLAPAGGDRQIHIYNHVANLNSRSQHESVQTMDSEGDQFHATCSSLKRLALPRASTSLPSDTSTTCVAGFVNVAL